jgi:hypothetical protein
VLICAEPDYGGRIDWPDLLIRAWQIEGLRRQGADPLVGRRLRELTTRAGLAAEVGIHPSQWNTELLQEQFEDEWIWLQRDVAGVADHDALQQAKASAKAAIARGERFLYVPTFYALGRKGQA